MEEFPNMVLFAMCHWQWWRLTRKHPFSDMLALVPLVHGGAWMWFGQRRHLTLMRERHAGQRLGWTSGPTVCTRHRRHGRWRLSWRGYFSLASCSWFLLKVGPGERWCGWYSSCGRFIEAACWPMPLSMCSRQGRKGARHDALLENAQTCLYGNQVSHMFGIDPPSLNDYFSW